MYYQIHVNPIQGEKILDFVWLSASFKNDLAIEYILLYDSFILRAYSLVMASFSQISLSFNSIYAIEFALAFICSLKPRLLKR